MSDVNKQEPTLEVRRRLVEQKRDQFRAAGYEAELEVTILSVQEASDEEGEKQRTQLISDARAKSKNCYRTAEELTRLLSKMPKPKAEAK